MRIEAAEHRLYWKILAVGIVVDLVGAAILAWGFQRIAGASGDDFFLATGIVWLALQLFRFIITLLNTARLWAAKEMGAFRSSGEAFLSALRNNGLPKPDDFTHSVDSYLLTAINDDSLSPKSRSTAACLYGVRQGTKNLGIVHSVFLDFAHEEALRRYAASHV